MLLITTSVFICIYASMACVCHIWLILVIRHLAHMIILISQGTKRLIL